MSEHRDCDADVQTGEVFCTCGASTPPDAGAAREALTIGDVREWLHDSGVVSVQGISRERVLDAIDQWHERALASARAGAPSEPLSGFIRDVLLKRPLIPADLLLDEIAIRLDAALPPQVVTDEEVERALAKWFAADSRDGEQQMDDMRAVLADFASRRAGAPSENATSRLPETTTPATSRLPSAVTDAIEHNKRVLRRAAELLDSFGPTLPLTERGMEERIEIAQVAEVLKLLASRRAQPAPSVEEKP